jgi:uncharacterized protein
MIVQQPQIRTGQPSLHHPSVEQLIFDITDRLVEKFNPENIYLFGSHVWGTPHADSDLDFLVIVSSSDISASKRSSIAYGCLRDIPYPLDILVKTRKEVEKFSKVSLSLEHQILIQGKCLYGRSARACEKLDCQSTTRSISSAETQQ